MSVMASAPLGDAVETRAQRLKRLTRAVHEALDRHIAEAGLFATRAGYGRFLVMQRRLHAGVDALYRDAALGRLIPDLGERRKLDLIDRDLADLGLAAPGDASEAADPGDFPAALGRLYVVEGSSLGAAFLAKDAARLGFDETFGARSLAGRPEGRGLCWRRFTQALDAVALSSEEEARLEAGAVAAFARARSLAEDAASAE